MHGPEREQALQDLMERYAPAIKTDRQSLVAALETAGSRTREIEQACGLRAGAPGSWPPWRPRCFLLMPLALAGKPVGFFYADRLVADPAGLAPEELNLVRMLRNQVLLALRTR